MKKVETAMHMKNTGLLSSDAETAQYSALQRQGRGTFTIKTGSFVRTVFLAAAMATGITACVPHSKQVNSIFSLEPSPPGAIIPEGLSEIKEGMTPEQVQRILGPRYPALDTPGRISNVPVADAFLYTEDGVTKYIEIWYREGRVDSIFFGYEEGRAIE